MSGLEMHEDLLALDASEQRQRNNNLHEHLLDDGVEHVLGASPFITNNFFKSSQGNEAERQSIIFELCKIVQERNSPKAFKDLCIEFLQDYDRLQQIHQDYLNQLQEDVSEEVLRLKEQIEECNEQIQKNSNLLTQINEQNQKFKNQIQILSQGAGQRPNLEQQKKQIIEKEHQLKESKQDMLGTKLGIQKDFNKIYKGITEAEKILNEEKQKLRQKCDRRAKLEIQVKNILQYGRSIQMETDIYLEDIRSEEARIQEFKQKDKNLAEGKKENETTQQNQIQPVARRNKTMYQATQETAGYNIAEWIVIVAWALICLFSTLGQLV